jgi:hypothetical protein
MVENGAATFIWSAVAERMTWRYQERGFRYLFLDAVPMPRIPRRAFLTAVAAGCQR